MSISIEINGVPYTGFLSASVRRPFSAISGNFELNANSLPGNIYPLRLCDSCRVLIDETPILNGYIEKLDISNSVGDHSITIGGRDLTSDIIDNTLDGTLEFSADITLKNITEKVISNFGLSNSISVIDESGGVEFKKSEIVSGEIGGKAWEFIEKYCRKKQIIGSSDGNGNIVLTRAQTTLSPNAVVLENTNRNNNILSSTVSFDNTERFHKYIVRSQSNNSALLSFGSGKESAKSAVNKEGISIDNNIRNSRVFNMIAESSSDNVISKDRAIWETNYRRSQAFVYQCVVQGFFSSPGVIWKPNMLVVVNDEFASVNDTLFLDEVIYKIDIQSGSLCELRFLTSDAYQLEAEKSTGMFNHQNKFLRCTNQKKPKIGREEIGLIAEEEGGGEPVV